MNHQAVSTPSVSGPPASSLGWPLGDRCVGVGLGWPRPVLTALAVLRPEADLAPNPLAPLSEELDVASTAVIGESVVSRETPLSEPAVVTAADVVAEHAAERGSVEGDIPVDPSALRGVANAASVGDPSLPRPPATRILIVANQKGGVGKTTTAVNIAAGMALHGLKVLVIDLDPQGNASTALSIEHAEGTPGIYQVIIEGAAMDDVLVESDEIPGLFVVPATIDLAGAEIELVSMVARETRLKKSLDTHVRELADVDDGYDYVFIDCPPSLGLLTVNALAAGRELLIPIQCEYYALEGLSALLRTIEQIREHLNPDLVVGAIVLTMFDARTRLAAGVADEVRNHFGDVVLKTAVPRSVRISEAPSYGQTVLTYDPNSAGARSYLQAATELAHQGSASREDHP